MSNPDTMLLGAELSQVYGCHLVRKAFPFFPQHSVANLTIVSSRYCHHDRSLLPSPALAGRENRHLLLLGQHQIDPK